MSRAAPPRAQTHFLLSVWQGLGLPGLPSPLPPAHKGGVLLPGCFLAGRMEDHEGPECGKPDFVLLDQVTMEDFMRNLQLR